MSALDSMTTTHDPDQVIPYALTPAAEAAVEAAKRWTITTVNDVRVSGHLPAWAEKDPSQDDVPADRLQLRLVDLTHTRDYGGPTVRVDGPFGEGGKHEIDEDTLCRAQIWCAPHSLDPEQRVPYAIVTVLEDCVIGGLDPAGVADLAAKLHAQAAVLDQVAVDLAEARADWAKNGGAR